MSTLGLSLLPFRLMPSSGDGHILPGGYPPNQADAPISVYGIHCTDRIPRPLPRPGPSARIYLSHLDTVYSIWKEMDGGVGGFAYVDMDIYIIAFCKAFVYHGFRLHTRSKRRNYGFQREIHRGPGRISVSEETRFVPEEKHFPSCIFAQYGL